MTHLSPNCSPRPEAASAPRPCFGPFTGLFIAAWLVFVLAGFSLLWHFGAKPGTSGAPPQTWPPESHLARDGRPTLVVFAHPQCPCTRASLAELERLLATELDKVDTHVLMIAPQGVDGQWNESSLRSIASGISGVQVETDVDRREARLFNAKTSGTCLLYDRSGQLVFHGGVTAARGHEGTNDGALAISDLLTGSKTKQTETPVFGCPLFEDQAAPSGRPQ